MQNPISTTFQPVSSSRQYWPQVVDECMTSARLWGVNLQLLDNRRRRIMIKTINDMFFEIEMEDIHNSTR
jgi:hypothetical protein